MVAPNDVDNKVVGYQWPCRCPFHLNTGSSLRIDKPLQGWFLLRPWPEERSVFWC